MYRRNFLKDRQTSNSRFHPSIAESRLSIDDKIELQHTLETKFNGDFRALIEDMMKYAIEAEEYEMAAIIRDELNKGI
jgi:protein-arginine kinase activator protein McsA